jgi:hypothetical protein
MTEPVQLGECRDKPAMIVRPGDRLLIEITFPLELDELEACHADIVLEDFLASRTDEGWLVKVHSVVPRE